LLNTTDTELQDANTSVKDISDETCGIDCSDNFPVGSRSHIHSKERTRDLSPQMMKRAMVTSTNQKLVFTPSRTPRTRLFASALPSTIQARNQMSAKILQNTDSENDSDDDFLRQPLKPSKLSNFFSDDSDEGEVEVDEGKELLLAETGTRGCKRKHKHKDCSLEEEEEPRKRVRMAEVREAHYLTVYEEVTTLGRGNFSEVRQVRHRLSGREFAVKISKKQRRLAVGEVGKEVRALEAVAGGRGVVRFHDSWVEDGQRFIVTELCRGGTLEDMINIARASKSDKMEEVELLKIGQQVVGGLESLKRAGWAHLDIKPENILVREEQGERAFLVGDLGSVEACGVDMDEGGVEVEMGDCCYVAPEMFNDPDRRQLDRADVFSLGLTLYAAATLHKMPNNSVGNDFYENARNGKLPYINGYSKLFNGLLTDCTRPQPLDRPGHSELLARFNKALRGHNI